MVERRRYKNPPIEEALCEFRFAPGQEWDLTMPGKLHNLMLEAYPGKPRQKNVVEATLAAGQDKTPDNITLKGGVERVQLLTMDGTRIVGVGKDVLSIHMLRPYQSLEAPEKGGWDEFYPRISSALKAYWDVAVPQGVQRIGIRFINKIVIPKRPMNVESYFNYVPPSSDGLPNEMSSLFFRSEYAYPDRVKLVLTYGSTDAPDDSSAFLLDLDVILEAKEPLDQTTALEKANELRERERNAFEGFITDASRRLFDVP
ncbi:MAG: TIGR04255 family protein [Myxococcales bacterium]|nr:MAG: TIGR04255 family protein [Myxococcales bacterium]